MRDSIVVHDSVIIRERADTIFFTKYKTSYKEVLKRDTVVMCDTLFTERVVTVEGNGKGQIFKWKMVSMALISLLLWRTGVLAWIWRMIKNR